LSLTQAEYLARDGLGLAELVAAGEVTPDDLLDVAVARTAALNPVLNAVVHSMESDARAAAKTPLSGPFAGVPFLTKDLQSTWAGHPTSAGTRALRDLPRERDSELARRWRAAGLLVFGKTSTPEFGLLPYTEPRAFGPCRNPWDPTRTPGGSSGGSAAVVAAGIVPMAGGGDGGGSIRIPAACCGLFGLKPTRGRTPSGPDFGLLWRGAIVEHAITRSVRDSAALLDATAGPDPGAPFEIRPARRAYLDEVTTGPGRLRVAYTARPPFQAAVDPECVAAVEDAARLLDELGHEVDAVTPDFDAEGFQKAFLTMVVGELGADLDDARQLLGRKPKPRELEPVTRALALLADVTPAREYATTLRWLERLGRRVGAFFVDYDLLLTPSLAAPAPEVGSLGPHGVEKALVTLLGTVGSGRLLRAVRLIDQAAEDAMAFTPFTPIFNVTGQPAMSIPLRWTDAGLPVGVQLVARLGAEDVLFRLAGQLERARPWFGRLPPLATSTI
jgi:amidase